MFEAIRSSVGSLMSRLLAIIAQREMQNAATSTIDKEGSEEELSVLDSSISSEEDLEEELGALDKLRGAAERLEEQLNDLDTLTDDEKPNSYMFEAIRSSVGSFMSRSLTTTARPEIPDTEASTSSIVALEALMHRYSVAIEKLHSAILCCMWREEIFRVEAEVAHLKKGEISAELCSPISWINSFGASTCKESPSYAKIERALLKRQDLENRLLRTVNDVQELLRQYAREAGARKKRELAKIQLRRECLEEKLHEYEDNSAQMLLIQSAIMECSKEKETVCINAAQVHEACVRAREKLSANVERGEIKRHDIEKGWDVRCIIESQARVEEARRVQAEEVALEKQDLEEKMSRYKEYMPQYLSDSQDGSLTAALREGCGNIAKTICAKEISSLEGKMSAYIGQEASICSDVVSMKAASYAIINDLIYAERRHDLFRGQLLLRNDSAVTISRDARIRRLEDHITRGYGALGTAAALLRISGASYDDDLATKSRAMSARIEARRGRGTAPMIRDKDDLESFKTAIFAECDRQFLEESLHHAESTAPQLQHEIDQAQNDIELCKQEEKELKRFYRAEKERREKEGAGVYSTNRAANLENAEKLEIFLAHRKWLDGVNAKKTEQHQHDEREARILARRTLGMASTISDVGFSNTAVFAERDRQSLAEDLLHLERRLANCMVSDVNGPQLQHDIDQVQSDIELCKHEEREPKRFHGTKKEQPRKEKVEEASASEAEGAINIEESNKLERLLNQGENLKNPLISNYEDYAKKLHLDNQPPETRRCVLRKSEMLLTQTYLDACMHDKERCDIKRAQAPSARHDTKASASSKECHVNAKMLQHYKKYLEEKLSLANSNAEYLQTASYLAACMSKPEELRRVDTAIAQLEGRSAEASTGNESNTSADTTGQNDTQVSSLLSDTQASNDHCVQVHPS